MEPAFSSIINNPTRGYKGKAWERHRNASALGTWLRLLDFSTLAFVSRRTRAEIREHFSSLPAPSNHEFIRLLVYSVRYSAEMRRERERLILFYFELLSNQYEKSLSIAGYNRAACLREMKVKEEVYTRNSKILMFRAVCLFAISEKANFNLRLSLWTSGHQHDEWKSAFHRVQCALWPQNATRRNESREEEKNFFIENNKF